MDNPDVDNDPLRTQPVDSAFTQAESSLQRRPFGVTLLVWLVLSLSAWGVLRLVAALRWWDVLDKYDARLSPLYLSITGAGWVLVGIVLLWSIWSIRRWAHPAIPISVSVWLVEYWTERIFFQQPRPNLPFAIGASILVLAITWIIALNRKTKRYLTKSEEHEQPEKSTTA